jgi:hypothetical protein
MPSFMRRICPIADAPGKGVRGLEGVLVPFALACDAEVWTVARMLLASPQIEIEAVALKVGFADGPADRPRIGAGNRRITRRGMLSRAPWPTGSSPPIPSARARAASAGS